MPDRDRLYDDAVETFGAAIERLARSYELDAHKRQDRWSDSTERWKERQGD